ncbi:restriction endonuclease [Streptomyces sp. RPT161]|uniref:restriction endonuclease n=1 Tax=Streptomyces sp. RPT161 TaxID=3015993 RepID=UPI0022B92131|nr:restriction endonuclease [Streptomyces sp. RPT161]
MTDYSATEIQGCIAKGLDKSLTAQARGDALEDLFCYLLEALPGVTANRKVVDRFKSCEVDLVVANIREARWLKTYPTFFLVECKNWDKPVNSQSVLAFAGKLEMRYVELGVLVAANGITGDKEDLASAHHIIEVQQSKGRRIVVVTLDHLRQVKTTEDFEVLLRDRLLNTVGAGHL